MINSGRKTFLRFALLVVAAAILLSAIGAYCWRQRSAGSMTPTGWYIESPEDYFSVNDRKVNEVVQWLQGMPYPKSYMGMLETSPYTYDEWLKRGKGIDGLEGILLAIYDSKYEALLADRLWEAFGEYGTQMSIDFFSEKLADSSVSPE